MTNYTISYEDSPSSDDIDALVHNLVLYNRSQAGDENWQELVLLIRDRNGEIVGGLNGYTHWGWLFIKHLWVAESLRGRGYGRALVSRAELEARGRGCNYSLVDTFDFQALPFYQKLGYEVFGVLEDFPPGHSRYFLQKRNLLSSTRSTQ